MTQLTFTCSKSTIETLAKEVKYDVIDAFLVFLLLTVNIFHFFFLVFLLVNLDN